MRKSALIICLLLSVSLIACSSASVNEPSEVYPAASSGGIKEDAAELNAEDTSAGEETLQDITASSDGSFELTVEERELSDEEKDNYISSYNALMLDGKGYMLKTASMLFAFGSDGKSSYTEICADDGTVYYAYYSSDTGSYARILEDGEYHVYHTDESDLSTAESDGNLSRDNMKYYGYALSDGQKYDVIYSTLDFSSDRQDIYLYYDGYELAGYNYDVLGVTDSGQMGRLSPWDAELPVDMQTVDEETTYDDISEKMITALEENGYFD